MAHGVSEILGERNKVLSSKKQKRMQQSGVKKSVGVMGSRRIFSPAFKLKVLESYRNDMDCRGNQRATARKYGIHRRQIQKWLQCEENLRNCLADGNNTDGIGKSVTRTSPKPPKDYVVVEKRHHQQQQQVQVQQQPQQQQQHQMHNGAGAPPPALNLCVARQHGDELLLLQQQQDQQRPPPPSPQQSPPLPPPPSTSSSSNSSSSIVAAQALAAAAAAASQHQTDYRFHSNAVTVLPPPPPPPPQATAAQTGYPELQNKIVRMPPYTNAQMIDMYQARAIAAFPDPALVPACYRRHSAAIAPQEINRYAELQYYRRSSSPRYHEIRSPMQQQEMSPATLLLPAQIKIERASPDSRTTPGSVDAIPSAYSSATTATGTTTTTTDSIRARSLPSPHTDFIPKKEQLTESEYRHEKISAISPERLSNSNTPPVTPYYNMSCLPLSPGDSDEPCSTEASDIETDQQTNDTHVVQRKSYPVRFKLEVLNAFRYDDEVKGNQRATARKYNICRRQVQKWLLQETDLRNVFKTTGNGDRQRLGPFTESISEETPVDLRTSHPSIPLMLAVTTAELGQISPRSTNSAGPCSCCDYRTTAASSPLNYAIESSLTPPYSAPGCSLSCCPDVPAPSSVGSNYYCYSPPEIDSHSVAPVHESSLKRPICTQSCCYTEEPASKRPHLDDKSDAEDGQEQPIQESPLCLVKPKHEESANPDSKVTKDAILFKPYLDNPVSKPNNRSSPTISNASSNNNNSSTCNYNVGSGNTDHLELQLSFKLPATQQPQDQQQHLQQQQPQPNAEQYLGYAEARSAFVRYPSNGHYS